MSQTFSPNCSLDEEIYQQQLAKLSFEVFLPFIDIQI